MTGDDASDDWIVMLLVCLANRDLLAPGFERQLVNSLEHWVGTPTDRQLAKLAEIHARVQQAIRTEEIVRSRHWRRA